MMPVLSTEYLNDTSRSTFQKAILDFDTSQQAFKRALLTGHVPGMIELPEYKYFGGKANREEKQDSLLYQI